MDLREFDIVLRTGVQVIILDAFVTQRVGMHTCSGIAELNAIKTGLMRHLHRSRAPCRKGPFANAEL